MRRLLEYPFLFVAVVLVQVFLLNNINISVYLYPMIYVVFLAMLPTTARPWLMMLSGLALGVSIDLLSGGAGLHAIASVFTAFIRPIVLRATVGQAETQQGIVPSPANVGVGKAFRYAALLVALHCVVYFLFEAMTVSHIYITLLRIAVSSAVSLTLVFAIMLLPRRR